MLDAHNVVSVLERIIASTHADADDDDRYIGYLQVLAALGTLDLGNQSLREKVQQVVGIS